MNSKYKKISMKHAEDCPDITQRIHKSPQDATLSKYNTAILRFEYPLSKNWTHQNLENLPLEEERLDESLHHLMQDRITAGGLQRTPPLKSPERLANARTTWSTNTPSFGDPFRSSQLREETAPPLATQVRNIPKTRGEAGPFRCSTQTALTEPEDASPPDI